MKEKRAKGSKPAVLFGEKTVKRVGYIEGYIFACEIKGADHIIYTKPRKPKYHLVIIVLEGSINLIVNGERIEFSKHSYINLPTWADIYEIEYGAGFHAMVTATDRNVVEDIFRNRNPFPQDFGFTVNHSLGGEIVDKRHVSTLRKDISNMIDALNHKDHHFAEEINYAYFYIMLTDMADMMWERYGKGTPTHQTDMKRSDVILKSFAELLSKNVLTETSVGFYAEKLCISKKYLALIVKEKTRVSIGTIIATMRTEAAARLLRDPEMSIQQIASKMSFSDQSAFGKFFKKQTGLSPLKYRQNLRKTLLSMRPAEILHAYKSEG
jgi:AraC-like DNA-binding protein